MKRDSIPTEPEALVNPFAFTIFSSNTGRLTKRLYLDEQGKFQKEHGGQLYDGYATQVSATDLHELVECLSQLQPNEAVGWGICDSPEARIASQNMLDRIPGAIARSERTFTWAAGPGVWMLDIDGLHEPSEAHAQLVEAMPELAGAEMVWRPSASAYVFDKDTGRQIRGCVGGRFYVVVDHANRIPDLGATLSIRLWQQGRGRIELSESGSMLPRTLVDEAVWRASGLDFAAAPVCEGNVERRPADPIYFGPRGAVLNTERKDFRWATAADAAERDRMVTAARRPKESAAAEKREKWAEAKAAAYDDPVAAKEFLTHAAQQLVLPLDFQITLASGVTVTVHEILSNGSKYDGVYCQDPLEPEKGDHKARINTSAREPIIYSFARGGVEYVLFSELLDVRPKMVNEREDAKLVADAIGQKFNDLYCDPKQDTILRVAGTSMQRLGPNTLAMVLSRRLQYKKFDKRAGKPVPAYWPQGLINQLTSAAGVPELGLRPLRSVVNRPFLRPNGTVVQAQGYDAITQTVYVNPVQEFPEVADRPTRQAAEAALALIEYPLKNFEPTDEHDRAGLLSAVLSAVVSSNVQCPIHIITSDQSGSGKTTACECVALVAGTPRSRLFPSLLPDREDEQEKVIPALLHDADTRALVFDNVDRAISGKNIEAITGGETTWSFRPFGSNTEMVTVELNKLILFNGIGARTGNAAMARRSVTINLKGDRGRNMAWDRIPQPTDPKGWIVENYPDLVSAALTVMRAYVAAGRPRDGLLPGVLGGFPEWDSLVRGSIHWLTGIDVYEQIKNTFDDANVNGSHGMRAVLYRAAYHVFANRPFTHAELRKKVSDQLLGVATNPKVWAGWAGGNAFGGLVLEKAMKDGREHKIHNAQAWVLIGEPEMRTNDF